MKKLTQIIGVILIFSPIIVVYTWILINAGMLKMLQVFGLTTISIAIVGFGTYLISRK